MSHHQSRETAPGLCGGQLILAVAFTHFRVSVRDGLEQVGLWEICEGTVLIRPTDVG